jgi:divalent metal cation (Fe/Co/Zn/Cd) transporter
VTTTDRALVVRRGLQLGYFGIAYNAVEAVIALTAGVAAGSVSLIGFGVDSVIEFSASLAALARLHGDHRADGRARLERRTHQAVGASFLALAVYVAWEAVGALVARTAPAASPLGIGIAVASLAVMPVLARAKRRVAHALRSGALEAESKQTSICAWLSAILVAGLGATALLGWWWADAVAALAMVPLIAWEGVEALRGRSACADGCA